MYNSDKKKPQETITQPKHDCILAHISAYLAASLKLPPQIQTPYHPHPHINHTRIKNSPYKNPYLLPQLRPRENPQHTSRTKNFKPSSRAHLLHYTYSDEKKRKKEKKPTTETGTSQSRWNTPSLFSLSLSLTPLAA